LADRVQASGMAGSVRDEDQHVAGSIANRYPRLTTV
jgi:hypothetical protein